MFDPVFRSGDVEGDEALHRFVRERRLRLAPESRFLGEHPRLPIRVGKHVTQEELAEHLGISRQWYARFERGAPAAFSTQILSRLSDLLLLSALERAELVRLAVPELAPVAAPDSAELYEALRGVRQTVKRLWSASSEAEIVQVVGEEARALLPHFELVFARRIAVPEDEARFSHPVGDTATRLADARADALRRLTPDEHAQLDASWDGTPAGVLLPFTAYPPNNIRQFRLALREHEVPWELPVAAHIRGASGSALVGGASTRPHDVTELEHTVLSTIADFASLALR